MSVLLVSSCFPLLSKFLSWPPLSKFKRKGRKGKAWTKPALRRLRLQKLRFPKERRSWPVKVNVVILKTKHILGIGIKLFNYFSSFRTGNNSPPLSASVTQARKFTFSSLEIPSSCESSGFLETILPFILQVPTRRLPYLRLLLLLRLLWWNRGMKILRSIICSDSLGWRQTLLKATSEFVVQTGSRIYAIVSFWCPSTFILRSVGLSINLFWFYSLWNSVSIVWAILRSVGWSSGKPTWNDPCLIGGRGFTPALCCLM